MRGSMESSEMQRHVGGCENPSMAVVSADTNFELRSRSLICPRRARDAARWIPAVGEGIGTCFSGCSRLTSNQRLNSSWLLTMHSSSPADTFCN